MPRAKTNEEYYEEVSRINPTIEVTGFYVNGLSKMHCRCKICGYIYEGEILPADFICPLCKHPASDFEKLK